MHNAGGRGKNVVKGDAAAAFQEKFAEGRLKVRCRQGKGLGEIKSLAGRRRVG